MAKVSCPDCQPRVLRRFDPGLPPREMLLIFARCPDVGACKTRLIPVFGAAGATGIHRRLLARTLTAAAQACPPLMRRCRLAQTGISLSELQHLAAANCPQAEIVPQASGDLGTRLAAAIGAAFEEGLERVVAIGTDCPDLTASLIDHAFRLLSPCDVVLGPTEDGGYYLIGLNAPRPDLFRDVDWGTERVLMQTMNHAYDRELTIGMLPELRDVDRPEDVRIEELVAGEMPV